MSFVNRGIYPRFLNYHYKCTSESQQSPPSEAAAGFVEKHTVYREHCLPENVVLALHNYMEVNQGSIFATHTLVDY